MVDPARDLAVGGRPPAPRKWVTQRLGTSVNHKWVTFIEIGNIWAVAVSENSTGRKERKLVAAETAATMCTVADPA